MECMYGQIAIIIIIIITHDLEAQYDSCDCVATL